MSVELSEIEALQTFDPSSFMVMIVDDSPFQRKKFVETLEKKGFLVVECSTGQECLDTLEEKIPNLILMDMTMPEMDGAMTCRKIRERKELAALPIVFLSANEDVGSKLSAFDSGASDYVLKTAPESELLVRIRNQIQFSNMVELLKSTLDQSKSLLHAVHHDLANYLSSVTGCYELMKYSLEGKDLEEGLQTNLDRMGHCIRSTNRFLKDLRQYDALKSGKVQLEFENVTLGELIEESRVVFEHHLIEKDIELCIEEVDVSACVWVDSWWFVLSVLNNLVSNAIKFSYSGSKINLKSRDFGDFLRLEVVDNGVGMTNQLVQEILTGASYRSTHGTNGERGTGFGVKMANRLMIAHGGSLTIHSQPKDSGFAWHGTRVILHIPKGDYCSGEKVFSGTNNLVV